MFLLEQQYDLNAEFFSTINFLIFIFIQGGSLSSEIIVSYGIKHLDYAEQRHGEKVNIFINIDIRKGS